MKRDAQESGSAEFEALAARAETPELVRQSECVLLGSRLQKAIARQVRLRSKHVQSCTSGRCIDFGIGASGCSRGIGGRQLNHVCNFINIVEDQAVESWTVYGIIKPPRCRESAKRSSWNPV